MEVVKPPLPPPAPLRQANSRPQDQDVGRQSYPRKPWAQVGWWDTNSALLAAAFTAVCCQLLRRVLVRESAPTGAQGIQRRAQNQVQLIRNSDRPCQQPGRGERGREGKVSVVVLRQSRRPSSLAQILGIPLGLFMWRSAWSHSPCSTTQQPTRVSLDSGAVANISGAEVDLLLHPPVLHISSVPPGNP